MERGLKRRLSGGTFGNVSESRSRNMAAIRGRGNRSTEGRIRAALAQAGIKGWALHPKGLPGNPDFLFASAKLAVFVDGCFWHGCPRCYVLPKSRQGYWHAKIDRNRARDKRNSAAAKQAGYRILRLWEHELKRNVAACAERIAKAAKKLSAK